MSQRRPVLSPRSRAALLALLCLLLAACAARAPWTLTVAHVNDTHSALEPADETVVLDGQAYRLRLGGMARIKTELDALRRQDAPLLFLHAGDAVQGTLYFNLFRGRPEFELLSALGLDAMCLGNHEFDRGVAQLGTMLNQAAFPVLAANLDVSEEPALAGRVRPWALLHPGGRAVGVVGLLTPDTPFMTASVGRVRFLDPAQSLARAVGELRALGAEHVIVLSHLGYGEDIALAKSVAAVDLIVGGHSHTLLGPREALGGLGLRPAGPYPTELRGPDGRTVLVVQAWKWGEMLGVLSLRFDAAGRLAGFTAAPRLLAGPELRLGGAPLDPDSPLYRAAHADLLASGLVSFPAEDPGILRRLAPYAAQVAALRDAPLGARLEADLVRGTPADPGPLVADAYLAKVPGAQLALVGAGGLRRDLPAGELTLGQVMGLLPFGNTLVALDITGAELKAVLEESVDYRLTHRPPLNGDLRRLPVTHPGGFRYVLRPGLPMGQRIAGLRLLLPGGGDAPLDMAATYRLVTNSFLAGGGDGLFTLKGLTRKRVDTGFLEHDAFAEYASARKSLRPAPFPRTVIETQAPGLRPTPQSRPGAALRLPVRPLPPAVVAVLAA